MTKPATLCDAVALLRRSQLVDERRLEAYLAAAAGGPDPTPAGLFAGMVRDGVLTAYQADQLGEGKWKGFRIGGYRVLSRIGRGGMGTVFLVEHLALGCKAAVKVLDAAVASNPVARERFVREARAAARLNHPNVVRVLDVSVDADPAFLVMDYVDGVSLQAAVARHGRFAPGDAAHCGRQIALGLQHAHVHGLVHRDVKPANVLTDRRGCLKLLDLGIVRVEGEDFTRLYHRDKMILGTADYLAPEQAEDSSAVDTRADVYSLGATLYFLLAGHPPFPDGLPSEKLRRLQTAPPRPIRELRPDVPDGLAAVVHRMLAKRPADRFQKPIEAADALARWAETTAGFPAAYFAAVRKGDAGRPTHAGGITTHPNPFAPPTMITSVAPAPTAAEPPADPFDTPTTHG